MEKKLPIVNILWTGGWDSTFRVLWLSRYEVEIQPHYIYNTKRISREIEIETMKKITEDIRKDDRTKAVLRDVKIVRIEDIQPNKEIDEALKRAQQKLSLGDQYGYLARYADSVKNLEIGIEAGGNSENFIQTFGKMILIKDENGFDQWVVDKDNSHEDLIKVYGCFRFPIYHMPKLEEKEEAIKLGFIDTMYKTWFCHYPKNGKPCGTCVPCKGAIEDGLPERLPEEALKRYEFEKKHEDQKVYKLYKKVRRKFLKY